MLNLTPELTNLSKPGDRDIARAVESLGNISPMAERVLRTIARNYHRKGYSHAPQARIAATVAARR